MRDWPSIYGVELLWVDLVRDWPSTYGVESLCVEHECFCVPIAIQEPDTLDSTCLVNKFGRVQVLTVILNDGHSLYVGQ